MENSLQKKMTLTSLIKYTLPTIVMMVLFSWLYNYRWDVYF